MSNSIKKMNDKFGNLDNIEKMLNTLQQETPMPVPQQTPIFQSRASVLKKRMEKQNRVRNCLKIFTCWFCCTACNDE